MKSHTIHRVAAAPMSALALALLLPAASSAEGAGSTNEASSSIAQASSEINMHHGYARALARTAYLWGYPMVNMHNRRAKLTQAPEPGLLYGVLPVAPANQLSMLHDYINPFQRAVACPNQDVVYGLGFMDLSKDSVVLQVPDFGDRFWVYAIYDQRTDQVGELGRPYGSKPGSYLVVGPDWNGETPESFEGVLRSPTNLTCIIPRIFMNNTDEDRAAIQPLVNQVVAYPLAQHTGKPVTNDWSKSKTFGGDKLPSGGETKWVEPEQFFDVFAEVLDEVPPMPGEEAIYSQFRALMAIADRDEEIEKLLVETAVETDKEVIHDFLQWTYNGKPAGNNWNRSQHNAEWGFDFYNRVSTSRSNIFDNRPSETQYFYTDNDASGEALNGSNTYRITFPKGQQPPVKGFWSLTLYDETHFFYDNDLKRYSLGTKNDTLQLNEDGSLTLYAGNNSPGKEKETNWLPAPEGPFSLYIRAYWGEASILDGSWQPPAVQRIEP